MAEATYLEEESFVNVTATAALVAGQVVQLVDGRCGYYNGLATAAIGDTVSIQIKGKVTIAKVASFVLLDGDEAWFTVANNNVTGELAGDLYAGVVVGDTAAADTTAVIDLNVKPTYKIDMTTGWDLSTVLTSGTPTMTDDAGIFRATMSATAEAQICVAISRDSVAIDTNCVAVFHIDVVDDGDAAALDVNIGMANGSHATDADSITESVFVHLDGNVVNILLESDDGTTEVAAADSTIDYVLGTAFEVKMDFRNPADVQIYINGVLALGGTTFNVDAATGPWLALVHLEKTSDNTTADVQAKAKVRQSAANF